ncbi:MAG TPA: hypothetical protein ENG43_00965 [Candidatus Bathyarchaeota archaeon]|nr:hypothetical protein [Candidatus Bathyarchaeota archaeon]HEW89899.1 hypothetical protein [Candidatus Bathyarchaeota archaeon]
MLTLMALYYPDVNKPVTRLTAFLGLVYGLYNVVPPLVLLALGTYVPEAIWRGTILHLPLLITSAYALGLTTGTLGPPTSIFDGLVLKLVSPTGTLNLRFRS